MLLNATHLGLIGPLPVGLRLCYANCPTVYIDCDCPQFLGI